MSTNDITFGISASFIKPVGATDTEFLDLMEHLCTIERMAQSVVSASSYGHKTISKTEVAVTYENIRCRLRSLSQDELQTSVREGETVDNMFLYIPIAYVPQTMREPSSTPRYQVSNVRTLGGEPVDAGSYDVQAIRNIAGERHHYLLTLLKVS